MNCSACTQDGIKDFRTLNNLCVCSHFIVPPEYSPFFARSPVFVSKKIFNDIRTNIATVEKVITSDIFQCAIQYQKPLGRDVRGGILMSYDYHLDGATPKLIEINTNAGGFFLNQMVEESQEDCCVKAGTSQLKCSTEKIVWMFQDTFVSQKGEGSRLGTVAIVDENPGQQFLYPEFLICKEVLEKNGIKTFIASPDELEVKDGAVYLGDTLVDLVYNRLTDFYFEKAEHLKFKAVLQSDKTTISPNPDDHRLYADKVNLIHILDEQLYGDLLSENEIALLKETVPESILVAEDNAVSLWEQRKHYFFKPLNGFGGGGAYNGKGLTKRVWENIQSEKYIAQKIVRPDTKIKEIEGIKEAFKFDVRAYVYKGEVLLLCARIYQGQTTNFRTIGGGFAPIFITEN